jgi:homoserine dehydrogenase
MSSILSRPAEQASAARAAPLGIALYGCGTVGSGLVQVLRAREAVVDRRVPLELLHVVVRDLAKPRPVTHKDGVLSRSLMPPIADPRVQIVVELIGGLEPAHTLIAHALRSGKHVITANKAVIATHGAELESLAAQNRVLFKYGAAVGGAIPILHTLRGPLGHEPVKSIRGIVNGTTNYILTQMAEQEMSFDAALASAQALGFAEADPFADVSGLDAAQKIVILARHAFGRWVSLDEVKVTGIDGISASDIRAARAERSALKLVADARMVGDQIRMHVAPALVTPDDPLYAIRNEMNAIIIDTEYSGPLILAGAGAGGRPTGSAVFSDIARVARAIAERRDPTCK